MPPTVRTTRVVALLGTLVLAPSAGCGDESSATLPLGQGGTALPGGAGGVGGQAGAGGSEGASGGSGGSGGVACVATTEICDGIDNDCDDDVDEGCPCVEGETQECYSGDPTLLGHGVCLAGEQSCSELGEWGECVGEVLPAANEECNGLDDDCDDATDEDLGVVVCGLGICQVTVPACEQGATPPCVPTEAQPPEECEGVDDDCDGAVDEDCPCVLGEHQDCYTGSPQTRNVGTCHDGWQTCSAQGTWSGCAGDKLPTSELCDGLDNDCNGAPDDGNPGGGANCDTGLVGVCAAGTWMCQGGQLDCVQDDPPSAEVCDGLDNDCDEATLDGLDDPYLSDPCDGPDADLCEEGVMACVAGALACTDTTGNSLDVCDGVDNDCDGASLDGAEDPFNGSACDGPDSDLCVEGQRYCANGVLSCSDNTGHSLDVCDGLDNDCDAASADGSEDPLVGIPCDGADADSCKEGTSSCVASNVICSDNTADTPDVCDGQDNDCNPSTLDGSQDPLVGATCDGPDGDLCKEGTYSCSMGALSCSDNTGNTLDVCDGGDNDCDPASADGSEDSQVGTACDGPDSDLCLDGTRICSGGVVSCDDGPSTGLDVCDGIDNDCNPSTADGSQDPLVGTSCDGSDSDLCKEGTYSCSAGVLGCSDNTGSTLDVCDGADNDCDPSSVDGSEDVLVGIACDGADSDLCKEGTSSCAGGTVSCSDSSGSTVDVCDGQDNDCDPASADGSEDPLNGQACDGPDSDLCLEGNYGCSAGALVCNDNTSSNLDVCDGANNDCDTASADGSEDPQLGVACDGADGDLCQEGTRYCSGGALLCNDTTSNLLDVCDGLDNDCDPASADGAEDPQSGTACDGPDGDLCAEGTRFCSGAVLQCSDNTGNALDVCDGVNNDCDPASADGSEDPLVGVACDGPDGDLCAEGTRYCSGGAVLCSDTTSTIIEECGDGIDNDCDGSTEEGCAAVLANGSFETGDFSGWALLEDSGIPEYGTWGLVSDGTVVNLNDSVFDHYDSLDVTQSSDGLPITFASTDGSMVALQLQNGPELHRMYQDVVLPGGVTELRWDMAYANRAGTHDPTYQYIAIHVRNPDDDSVLATIFQTTEGVDPAEQPTMTTYVADLSAFAGATVRIDVEVQVQNYYFDVAFDHFVIS